MSDKKNYTILLVYFLFLLAPLNSIARTWYITIDGSGDAPTIQAGIDSSMSADSVVVAPGTYEISHNITMKDGVILISDAGPYATKIVPKPLFYPSHALGCNGFRSQRTEISGFWIDGFRYAGGGLGAVFMSDCHNLYFNNNILSNSYQYGFVMTYGYYNTAFIENNTFIDNGDYGVFAGSTGFLTHNIIWDRGYGIENMFNVICNDFLNLDDAGYFAGSNWHADPEFCGAGAGNFYLQSDSPCAPGNCPNDYDCGLIGALPVNCGSVDVKRSTWGKIKSMYQE